MSYITKDLTRMEMSKCVTNLKCSWCKKYMSSEFMGYLFRTPYSDPNKWKWKACCSDCWPRGGKEYVRDHDYAMFKVYVLAKKTKSYFIQSSLKWDGKHLHQPFKKKRTRDGDSMDSRG